ncbi:MAG TPA: YfcE family phosphodiesterase [Candidatus Nanoarchaeia archaeon]|nr:YfcE family phosphodiesterase [Candidatus Nanoarchaeia archaeon]
MIGLISDTHDNVPNVMRAAAIFRQKKVERVIHLGDIIAPATVPFFKGLQMTFIPGNNDGDHGLLQQRIAEIGGKFLPDGSEITIAEKRCLLFHGKDRGQLRRHIASGNYDYVLYGHDHTKHFSREGKTFLLNPGGHYLAPGQQHSIALWDPRKDAVEFIPL